MRTAGILAGLSLFAAAMWAAWLGWDHEYYYLDGRAQGPYRAWQVIGCGGCIVGASSLAWLYLQRSGRRADILIPLTALAADLGFTIPWTIDATTDDSGLWVVGLLLLLPGAAVGLMFVLGIVAMSCARFFRA